ncbi:MAG: deoxynucleoside kinase [Bacteroidales bacterium]|nr:deoxynucleoside kinase [Bacteroidales bacterium]
MQYVVIEGNIGAGKTTLARMLSEKHNAKLVLERINENPFLAKFYDNPDRFAFQMELSFLADRYKQMNEELKDRDLFQPLTISDYYLMKSLIFSKINLGKDEFRLYRQVFDMMNQNAPKPDVYVYLHAPLNNLIKNIRNRGRFYEQRLQSDYLVKIQEGYMDFFKVNSELKILILDVSNLDFVNSISDFEKIDNVIFQKKLNKESIKFNFSRSSNINN